MRQRWVGVLLFLVAVVAGIGAVWTYLSDQSGEIELVLEQIDGEVVLAGPDGTLKTPEVGAVLSDADHLETGDDARAVLGLGQETRIRLGPESSLRVTSVGAEGVKLELEDGALQATVRPGAPVRVANSGREVVATNAEFRVGVSQGVLQVETEEGELGLVGAANQTRLEAGSSATIVDRKAVIAPIPEELLLDVRWPVVKQTRATHGIVTGTTVPGAKVRVVGPTGEVVGVADGEGAFSIEVGLDEGLNEVTVYAMDPLGRTTDESAILADRDTRAPRGKTGVRYGN